MTVWWCYCKPFLTFLCTLTRRSLFAQQRSQGRRACASIVIDARGQSRAWRPEAVYALCPALTTHSLHRSSCPPRPQRQPQLQLPPSLDSKISSKRRSNRTKSRPRRIFSPIRLPPSYNHAIQLLQSLLSFTIKFDNSRKKSAGDERLTKWLGPTVNVLNAFSATVSGGVSLVSFYLSQCKA